MQPHLTFIQITDTHVGPTRDFDYYGYRPIRCLERVVSLINDLPQQPDFVVHTGDLIADRSAEATLLAVDALSRLRVPLYVVNGNHDDRALLRKMLDAPHAPDGNPDGPLDYTFEVKGERFLVLDGHTPDVPDPLGKLSAAQIEQARAEAASGGSPLTVLLHYPPFRMGSPWLDENMLLVNGEALHEALLPARDRLRGVFCGHLHRSCQITRDGITYFCGPSASAGYAWRPWDETPQVDHDYPPAYSVVQYFEDQVIAHQYTFPRP